MSDIDLIPVEYRNWLQCRSTIIHYGLAILILNVAVVLAGETAGYLADRHTERAAELATKNLITQQQQMQLQQLGEQKMEFERRWSLLRSLRAGASIKDVFSLIDDSIIVGDLWFLDWSFRRAGVSIAGQQRGVETGYFVIVSEGDEPLADNDLSVETHMTIRGQAKDHQALSKFVRALFEQRDIKDVNVQKTSQSDYADGKVVNFNMTVVLNSPYRDS